MHFKTWRLACPSALLGLCRIDNSIAMVDVETETEKADYPRVQRQLIENTASTYARVHGLFTMGVDLGDRTLKSKVGSNCGNANLMAKIVKKLKFRLSTYEPRPN